MRFRRNRRAETIKMDPRTTKDVASPGRTPMSPGRRHAAAKRAFKKLATLKYWVRSAQKKKPRWEIVASANAGQYGEALPGVRSPIKIRSEEHGYSFVIEVRLRTRFLSLMDVDEQSNSFETNLEVGLEWEVGEDQYHKCTEFWNQFRPLLYFRNAVSSNELSQKPIFGPMSEPRAHGVAMTKDARNGRQPLMLRHFEYRTRVQQRFQKPFGLRNFPFDSQTLDVEFWTEPTTVFGRLVHVDLVHPRLRDDFDFHEMEKNYDGRHVFEQDADNVDDMRTAGIFALTGRELFEKLRVDDNDDNDDNDDVSMMTNYFVGSRKEEAQRVETNRYVVMIFVYRQYQSTRDNVIIPLGLMYVLSFMAFFVPPCQIFDRASVTLTLFLSVIALKTYMSERLPKVPYSTAVENFLMIILRIFVVQSILMMTTASYCIRFGALGQLGVDPSGFSDFEDDDWDCILQGESDEGKHDFFCANRRVRMQNVADTAAIWISICMGVWGLTQHVLRPYRDWWKSRYLVRKLLNLYIDTATHQDVAEARRARQRRDVRRQRAARQEKKLRQQKSPRSGAGSDDDDDDDDDGFFDDDDDVNDDGGDSCGGDLIQQYREKQLEAKREVENFECTHERYVFIKDLMPDEIMALLEAVSRAVHMWFARRAVAKTKKKKKKPLPPARARIEPSRALTATATTMAAPPETDAEKDAELRHKENQRRAVEAFADIYRRRADGYENQEYSHRFNRPPWEAPGRPSLRQPQGPGSHHMVPKVTLTHHQGNYVDKVTKKMILFDCGTGETKALKASLVEATNAVDGSTRTVKLEDKGKPFAIDDKHKKVSMPDYCQTPGSDEFREWVEDHVAPALDYEIAPGQQQQQQQKEVEDDDDDAEDDLEEDDPVKLFGLDIEPVPLPTEHGQRLYAVKSVYKSTFQARVKRLPRVTLEPGTAVVGVNGEAYTSAEIKYSFRPGHGFK